MIGNGYCNDETNNQDCGFDGGDCCGSCVMTNLCTNCSCLENATGGDLPNPLLGDGYCNDETNIADCNYDGGDCCLTNLKVNHCSNCSCSNNGVITSPGFPHGYNLGLDMYWLIELPPGQLIEFKFISFEVGSM